jgi:hypothetical protein
MILLFCKVASADSFMIKISYLEGEKSKDSWTKTSEINVSGSEITYTSSKTGHGKGVNRVTSKACTLSDEDMKKVQDYIVDKNMLVTDSLIDNEFKYKAYERFASANVFLSYGERIGRIKLNGDLVAIGNNELYIKVSTLFQMLEDMAGKC